MWVYSFIFELMIYSFRSTRPQKSGTGSLLQPGETRRENAVDRKFEDCGCERSLSQLCLTILKSEVCRRVLQCL